MQKSHLQQVSTRISITKKMEFQIQRIRAFGRTDNESLNTESCLSCKYDLQQITKAMMSDISSKRCEHCKKPESVIAYGCITDACSLKHLALCKLCARNVCINTM